MIKRKNYLNNRDLLKEIHKSKNTYSSFIAEGDDVYDIILPNIDKINIRTVAQAKRNQADRIQKQNYEEARALGKKVKQADFLVDWKKINKKDLVFRIMTHDHIPLHPGRKKNPKTVADHHVQCNFPPFQHYRIDDDDNPILVGKSHWEGGLENGQFSKTHGKTTSKLARMYMKLWNVGLGSNWHELYLNDGMRSQALLQLTQIGLQFDDRMENPFAYYTGL